MQLAGTFLGLGILLSSLATAQEPAQDAPASEPVLEDDVTLDGPSSSPGITLDPVNSDPVAASADATTLPLPPPAVDLPPPPVPAPVVENTTSGEATTPPAATTEEVSSESEEDSTAESEPAVPETPKAVLAAEPPPVAEADNSEIDARNSRLYGNRLFGQTRINLAVNRPDFTEQKEIREKLYGAPVMHPSLTVDWFPFDWWVNPGLALRAAGYTVTGKAAKGSPTQSELDSGDVEIDENSKTRLLFIPLMAAAKVEMTPFRGKWLVLEGWVGYEYGWWQETRDVAASVRPIRMAAADGTTDDNDSVLTTKGSKKSMVVGAAANILLNWLDEKSVRSMVDTMGMSHIYLSPFFETVRSTDTQGLSFNRNTIGLGFTFESVK